MFAVVNVKKYMECIDTIFEKNKSSVDASLYLTELGKLSENTLVFHLKHFLGMEKGKFTTAKEAMAHMATLPVETLRAIPLHLFWNSFFDTYGMENRVLLTKEDSSVTDIKVGTKFNSKKSQLEAHLPYEVYIKTIGSILLNKIYTSSGAKAEVVKDQDYTVGILESEINEFKKRYNSWGLLLQSMYKIHESALPNIFPNVDVTMLDGGAAFAEHSSGKIYIMWKEDNSEYYFINSMQHGEWQYRWNVPPKKVRDRVMLVTKLQGTNPGF